MSNLSLSPASPKGSGSPPVSPPVTPLLPAELLQWCCCPAAMRRAQAQLHIHQRNPLKLTVGSLSSCPCYLPVCSTVLGFCVILQQRAGSFGPESTDWILGLLLTTGTDNLEQNQPHDYGTILSYFLCYQICFLVLIAVGECLTLSKSNCPY